MAKTSQRGHSDDQSPTPPGSADFDTFPAICPTSVRKSIQRDEWETLKSRIRDATDVVELLKKRPDKVRSVQSTLVFHREGTEPDDVPSSVESSRWRRVGLC